MKRVWFYIVAIIILLAIVAVVFLLPKSGTPAPALPLTVGHTQTSSSLATYRNREFNFEMQYPKPIRLFESKDTDELQRLGYISICGQNSAACFCYPKEAYAGTNFDGAGLIINILADRASEHDCLSDWQVVDPTTIVATKINGVQFATALDQQGAAGHFVTDRVYRTFHGQKCLELRIRVATTNFDFYDPGTIKKFATPDENRVVNELTSILNTLKFGQ